MMSKNCLIYVQESRIQWKHLILLVQIEKYPLKLVCCVFVFLRNSYKSTDVNRWWYCTVLSYKVIVFVINILCERFCCCIHYLTPFQGTMLSSWWPLWNMHTMPALGIRWPVSLLLQGENYLNLFSLCILEIPAMKWIFFFRFIFILCACLEV